MYECMYVFLTPSGAVEEGIFCVRACLCVRPCFTFLKEFQRSEEGIHTSKQVGRQAGRQATRQVQPQEGIHSEPCPGGLVVFQTKVNKEFTIRYTLPYTYTQWLRVSKSKIPKQDCASDDRIINLIYGGYTFCALVML